MRILKKGLWLLLLTCIWSAALLFAIWAFGALSFDFPWGRAFVPWVFAALVGAAIIFGRSFGLRLFLVIALSLGVLLWWRTLQPSNERTWQPPVAKTAWAEIDNDRVIIHNVRNFNYKTGQEPEAQWETREIDLRNVTGVDLFINYWGSDLMAHPIISFQFSDGPPLAFSIETRREVGEDYSAIGGIYRQYELIFIAADERDVVRLRTNHSKGETLYLYRTALSAAAARERLMEYLESINELHRAPRWYHAVENNCTTSIRSQHPRAERSRWDWRILVNGLMDELFYQHRLILTGGLPFAELKSKALINPAANSAENDPDFSLRIREDRPGF